MHEGVKYPCKHCVHQSTSKSGLARHQKVVYERINSILQRQISNVTRKLCHALKLLFYKLNCISKKLLINFDIECIFLPWPDLTLATLQLTFGLVRRERSIYLWDTQARSIFFRELF